MTAGSTAAARSKRMEATCILAVISMPVRNMVNSTAAPMAPCLKFEGQHLAASSMSEASLFNDHKTFFRCGAAVTLRSPPSGSSMSALTPRKWTHTSTVPTQPLTWKKERVSVIMCQARCCAPASEEEDARQPIFRGQK